MTATLNEFFGPFAASLSTLLTAVMVGGFLAAVVFKACVHYMAYSKLMFSTEFGKRVHRHLDKEYEIDAESDYEQVVGFIMQRTWVEIYQMRQKNMRRRFDRVSVFLDHSFSIEAGSKRLITDTLKEMKYVKPGQETGLHSTIQFNSRMNPHFNTLFSVFSLRWVNRLLANSSSLFLYAGCLAALSGVCSDFVFYDPTDTAEFLPNIGFSLSLLGLGFFCALGMKMLNAVLPTEELEEECGLRLVHGLELLWHDTLYVRSESSVHHTPPITMVRPAYDEVDEAEIPPIPTKSA